MLHKRCVSVIVLVSCTVWFHTVSARTPEHGWLKTYENHLLNERGNIVQLKGMSFFWSRADWYQGTGISSFYSSQMVDFLVDQWKCTVVRAAYDRDEGADNGWSDVQKVIDEAIAKGIYVVIDWHAHDAHEHEAAAVKFFTEQATKYKDTPNVIFEPYNEPITAGEAIAGDGSVDNARETWTAIKPYLTNVTRAIRGTGAKNLVVVGTPYFCQHVGVAAGDPLTDNGKPFENLAYSFHFYAASHGPDAIYGGGMEATYLDAGVKSIPVFVTEWGTSHSDGGLEYDKIDPENTAWWFEKFVDKYHLSWCNWSVSNWQASSSFAAGSITNPSPSGQIVKNYLADTADEWVPEWVIGVTGPAKDTVFTMPASFHQASSYNNYYGAHVEAVAAPYSYRDHIDRRIPGTLGYDILKVTPGTGDNWVSYSIDAVSPCKRFFLRYHARDGAGTVEVQVDDVTIGQVALSRDSTWTTAQIPVDIAAGRHRLKFNFVNTTDPGYLIEWFELQGSAGSIAGRSGDIGIALPELLPVRNGIRITLPSRHGFDGYSVVGVDGRSAVSATLHRYRSLIEVNGLSAGVWIVKFEGMRPLVVKTAVTGR